MTKYHRVAGSKAQPLSMARLRKAIPKLRLRMPPTGVPLQLACNK